MEMVQAQVVHAIEAYLNPPVSFYSLQEQLNRNLSPAQIFNGPYIDYDFECDGTKVLTKPGFVNDEDLDATQLRQVVYASDLINAVMDVPGVVSIRNLLLRIYDEFGEPVGPGEKWCLPIAAMHQPMLDLNASKLLFFKNSIPFKARRREFERTLMQLRGIARREAFVDPDERLHLVPGTHRDPGKFLSVQHDFPQTYGIGKAGLAQDVAVERIAQARQFKAYLTVFDQILADHLAQLASVKTLFSLQITEDVDPQDASLGKRLMKTRAGEPVGGGHDPLVAFKCVERLD